MPYTTSGKSRLLLLPCHLAIYLADYDRRNNIRSSCVRSINHRRYSDESSHIAFCWNRLVCMANPLDRSMVDLVSQNASYIESHSPSSNCNIDLFYIVHCIQYHDLLDQPYGLFFLLLLYLRSSSFTTKRKRSYSIF